MDNPFSLSGKTILVTGASSGIGRSTAELCARMGARVILTGRNIERLQQTLDTLHGDNHVRIDVDLTEIAQRNRLVQEVPELDGIVHCAGVGHRKPAKYLTEQDITMVMSINFNSAVLLQAAIMQAGKIKKGASVVFLSSRAAEIPATANALYSASKGALVSYAKCLSLEVAPRKIRVNCICPAIVRTPLWLDEGITEEELREQESRYPLKRCGQPEDIANLAVFLLSEASSWMTGSCIDITGGVVSI